MVCPVALFANALTWLLRALAMLLWRVGTAVIVAGTVFGIAVMVAEHANTVRSHAFAKDGTILSEIVAEPVIGSPHG